MVMLKKLSINTVYSALISLCLFAKVQAHIMVEQHGTLNVVEDGVFMVMSLPVTAFDGTDDDVDGKLSLDEFKRHRAKLIELIHAKVSLSDGFGKRPLRGVMLSPVTSHSSPQSPVSQLIVMGKFDLEKSDSVLIYHVDLFGRNEAEQTLKIIATRKPDNLQHVFELTPNKDAVAIFSK